MTSTQANKGMKQTKPAQAMELRSLSPVLGEHLEEREGHVLKARCGLGIALLAVVGCAVPHNAVEIPLPPPAEATSLLIANLASPDHSVREGAAWQLAGAKELWVEASAALEPLLNDADRAVRYAAAWSLGHLLYAPNAKKAAKLYETPPKPIESPQPEYPNAALSARVEGIVLVEVLVGEEGESRG